MNGNSSMKRKLTILCLLVLGAALHQSVHAELRGPGKYHGRIVIDRWGGHHLANGAHITWIAPDLKTTVTPFSGQLVTVDVSEISDTWDNQIYGITDIRPYEPQKTVFRKLAINFHPWKWTNALGNPVMFNCEVKYDGNKSVQFHPGSLSVITVRKATKEEVKNSGHPSVVTARTLSNDTITYNYRRIADASYFKETDGRFETDSHFVYSKVLSKEFTPGTFQAWACYGHVSSKMITFSVLERTEARRNSEIETIKSLWRACRYNDLKTAQACLGKKALSSKGSLSSQHVLDLHGKLSKTYFFNKNLGWAKRKDGLTVEMTSFDLKYQLEKQPDKSWLITKLEKIVKKE